ncbi:hypothetical protein MCOR28_007172 [Pyricularia oryzae]|nr:hypothetical protein MCOR26_001609 [Pyricularia oryzae]KAI6339562.1 hypothetical protein MCOR28_007172 [Pyricularia oryzae]
MADTLDSIVKGAPLPGRESAGKSASGTSPISSSTTSKAGDPLSHTPSSPSMIYLNLLVLEASLRAQYLELRARRRHHSFFLTLLTLWTCGFGYALFFAPREDGRGVGGSVYWMVDMAERVCFTGGLITVCLVWATGIWDRGVRWPRRWFAISNRGLRGFNCKIVIQKQPWWAETLATTGWFLTYGLFSNTGSSYRYVDPQVLREVDAQLNLSAQGHPALPVVSEDEERGAHEEDLAPGGDYLKLLLFAKPFSPTFRENWELFRTEYWERENERRALIRVKVKEYDKKLRMQRGGWLWWLPRYKVRPEQQLAAAQQLQQHSAEKPHGHSRHASTHLSVEREHRRTRSSSVRRGSFSSNATSRSATPTIEVDEACGVTRRASTASNASDKRRKKLSAAAAGPRSQKRTTESRSVTPEVTSPLAKKATSASDAMENDGNSGADAVSGEDQTERRTRKKSLSRSPAPSVSSMDSLAM